MRFRIPRYWSRRKDQPRAGLDEVLALAEGCLNDTHPTWRLTGAAPFGGAAHNAIRALLRARFYALVGVEHLRRGDVASAQRSLSSSRLYCRDAHRWADGPGDEWDPVVSGDIGGPAVAAREVLAIPPSSFVDLELPSVVDVGVLKLRGRDGVVTVHGADYPEGAAAALVYLQTLLDLLAPEGARVEVLDFNKQTATLAGGFVIEVGALDGVLDAGEALADIQTEVELGCWDHLTQLPSPPQHGEKPAAYGTVFLSYGFGDHRLVEAMRTDFRQAGVETWWFPQDAPAGGRIHHVVRSGIRKYDRMVLLCSRHALVRPGVINEIEECFQREAAEGGSDVVIPVILDDVLDQPWWTWDGGGGTLSEHERERRKDLHEVLMRRVHVDLRSAAPGDPKWQDAVRRVLAVLKKQP